MARRMSDDVLQLRLHERIDKRQEAVSGAAIELLDIVSLPRTPIGSRSGKLQNFLLASVFQKSIESRTKLELVEF